MTNIIRSLISTKIQRLRVGRRLVSRPRLVEQLNSITLPPPEVITRALLDDLAVSQQDFILVWDDYHVIHYKAIHEPFLELVSHPLLVETMALTLDDHTSSVLAAKTEGWPAPRPWSARPRRHAMR